MLEFATKVGIIFDISQIVGIFVHSNSLLKPKNKTLNVNCCKKYLLLLIERIPLQQPKTGLKNEN